MQLLLVIFVIIVENLIFFEIESSGNISSLNFDQIVMGLEPKLMIDEKRALEAFEYRQYLCAKTHRLGLWICLRHDMRYFESKYFHNSYSQTSILT